MSREIRRVPKKWQHPRRIKNQFQIGGSYKIEVQFRPMCNYDYKEDIKDYKKELKEWFEGQKRWNAGIYRDWNGKKITVKEALKMFLDDIEKDRQKHHFGADYKKEEVQKYKLGICSWEDVAGKIPIYPNPDDYMPHGEWYQLFEGVSEGTPLSPPFETKEELIEWLTKNKDYWGEQWTKEQAEAILKDEYAPSMVSVNGKIYNSRESLLLDS